MRVGIVGSRRRSDRDSVARLVKSLKRTDIVVSGGCRGVDTWAIQEADKRSMSHAEHLPLILPAMGRDEVVQAYYDRNRLVAENVDVLYCFVASDRTGGTENTIKWAKLAGVKIVIMAEVEEVDETAAYGCRVCDGSGSSDDINEACAGCRGTGMGEVDET